MSLNYCNRGSSGHSGRRRHRNRRDQVECNGGNGGSVESETAESRQPNNHRSPSFSNITSTNGDNLVSFFCCAKTCVIKNFILIFDFFMLVNHKKYQSKILFIIYLFLKYLIRSNQHQIPINPQFQIHSARINVLFLQPARISV